MRQFGCSLVLLTRLRRRSTQRSRPSAKRARRRERPISSSRNARQILHQREGEKLDGWLTKSAASQIHELQSFVQGIERDKAAVVAGLTLAQNHGLVEGKVKKLKLIKRMGYGRAGFPRLASTGSSRPLTVDT
jgi:transposase